MYSLGATVSLGGYQTQRIDVGFPLSQVPEGWTYQHVRGWVDAWFRYEVGQVIQREQARGNYEVEFPLGDGAEGPASLPPAHSALPLPPGSPWAPAPQSGGVSPPQIAADPSAQAGTESTTEPPECRGGNLPCDHEVMQLFWNE